MHVPFTEIRPGDISVFKRSGPISFILGGILKLFEPKWDFWGWHTGFVSRLDVNFGWMICESLAQGVVESPLQGDYRIYRWFDEQPTQPKIDKFVQEQLGKPYDVAIYFWTALQYLVRHFYNKRIPRLLDDRFTCWENVFEFTEEMGKRIGSKYDCPILPDMLKAFGEC